MIGTHISAQLPKSEIRYFQGIECCMDMSEWQRKFSLIVFHELRYDSFAFSKYEKNEKYGFGWSHSNLFNSKIG